LKKPISASSTTTYIFQDILAASPTRTPLPYFVLSVKLMCWELFVVVETAIRGAAAVLEHFKGAL
jgi:hypothetical protein